MASQDDQQQQEKQRPGRVSRRTVLKRAAAVGLSMSALGSILQACGAPQAAQSGTQSGTQGSSSTEAPGAAPAGTPVELLFTFWGSPVEKSSVESMVAGFNEANPGIVVRAQHIPTADNAYSQKMTTMLAGGTPPDVAYLDGAQAVSFASEDKLLDLTSIFESDAESKGRLETTYYRFGGKVIGASIGEIMLLYFKRDLFEAAGIAPPPSKAGEAWTWDQFVEVAKQLTKDRNGRDATSPDFDADNIESYGLAFPQTPNGYLPLIYSNGGNFADKEGTRLLLNSPEAVEVLQQMQDLIYVHHVAPTPAQTESFPATDIMMRTGKVAMDFNGHWKVLDYSQTDMDWGMAVLPRFKEPATMLQASARVIFADTKHTEAAAKFYNWHISPSRVDLFKKGLWMPAQEEYYTDEAKIAEWLDGEPGVYPPEARDVLIDYTLNHTPQQPPVYWLENLQQILAEAVNPAMQLLWTGKATAQEVADQAAAKAEPIMQRS